MTATRTLYAMLPPDVPANIFANMLKSLALLKNSVDEGRRAVAEAGNDPDTGSVVRVTLEALDANGKELS